MEIGWHGRRAAHRCPAAPCRPEASCLPYHRQHLASERLPPSLEAFVALKEPKVYQGIHEGLEHTIARHRFP